MNAGPLRLAVKGPHRRKRLLSANVGWTPQAANPHLAPARANPSHATNPRDAPNLLPVNAGRYAGADGVWAGVRVMPAPPRSGRSEVA